MDPLAAGRKIGVTESGVEGPQSGVCDEAENR